MKRMWLVVLCIMLLGGVAFARVQGDDPAGLVAMEAELYDAVVPADTNEFEWVFDTEIEGYVYSGYMRSFPIETNVGSDLARSPRLDYDVEMTQPGTYYIWARVLAPTSSQNSIHLGDSGVMTAERIDIPETDEWVWKNETNGGSRAMVEVNEPTVVTINCWMRESGACLDKLLLTSDPNYVPEGVDYMDSDAIRVQGDDPNGLVAMEAELYAANVPADTSEFEWVSDTELEWYSLEAYMRSFPIETNVGSELERSPRLDYDVEMTQTGTYYIWARALAPTSAQNSIHLGDSGVMTAERVNIPDGGWVWVNETEDDSRAVVEVNEPGMLTINCWMRESGACLDKLLLTMDPNYVPSGSGPRDPLVAGISLYVPMPIITSVPVEDMTFGVDDANNVILTSINGISTNDLVLGVTAGDPSLAGVEDDFIVEAPYGNDQDGLHLTMFDVPVTTIFIVEKDGNDSGKFQPVDAEGNPIGDPLSFNSDNFSDAIPGVNADGHDMSGTAITAEVPIYGIEIWATGLDPYSISALPAPAAPPAELVHKWTLDEADTAEGAVIADVVGGKDGVVVGTGVTSVMGVVDDAFAFDGASHVSIADMDTTDLKQISVTLWLNPDVGTLATGGYKRVFSGADNFEAILQPDTGQVGNNFYRSGGDYPLSVDPLPEGEWTHVALTSTLVSAGGSGLMTIYINGVLDASTEALATDDWAGGEMRIAHRPNSNPHFQGWLDDVRIYKGVITMGQLQAAINGE